MWRPCKSNAFWQRSGRGNKNPLALALGSVKATWYYCNYTLRCCSNERAQEVYDTICDWLSKETPSDIDWKHPWVGLLLIGSGVAHWNGKAFDPNYSHCGEVFDAPTLIDNTIRLNVNWKWNNYDNVIGDSVAKAFPDVTVLCYAAKENNDILLTNDKSFVNQCEIDLLGHEDDEFWELASSITGKPEQQLESELDWLCEQDWYVSGDQSTVDKLASTLLKDRTDDNIAELNNVYDSYLKISCWEFQEIKRSSTFQ